MTHMSPASTVLDTPAKPAHNARVRSIADQLRQAIKRAEKRGVTRYQIAKESGVSQSMLSRFMAGKYAARIDTAEKIMKAIGGRIHISMD